MPLIMAPSVELSPTIILTDKLEPSALRILLEHGLWSRCGPQFESQWKTQMKADEIKRQGDKKTERTRRLSEIDNQISMLKRAMPFYLVDRVIELYPYVFFASQNLAHTKSL
jgi:hypothetical protein